MIEKVNNLGTDVKKLRDECDEREAAASRTRILRFGDEILHDVHHSKEHFDQVLLDITNYERYCNTHPDFANHITQATTRRIHQVYDKCMAENSFLY